MEYTNTIEHDNEGFGGRGWWSVGGASLSLVGRGAFEFAPTFNWESNGKVLVYVEKCLHVHYLESNRERCWCCSKLEGLYTLLCTFESFRVMC